MNTKLDLQNAEGKRLLQKNYLDYSRQIIEIISDNPEILPKLLETLDVSLEQFYKYISGEENANITFYDKAYDESLRLSNAKKYTKNKDDFNR